jgi:hypothetical protein
MSIPAVMGTPTVANADFRQFDEGIGPLDLRDYLERIERAGELRITSEVDLIEEMPAIVYLAARKLGRPLS